MILDAKDLIAAIKTVRSLGQDRYKVSGFSGGERIVLEPLPSMDLKSAKDFVEDVMALGVQRYLDIQQAEQARLRAQTAIHRRSQSEDIKF